MACAPPPFITLGDAPTHMKNALNTAVAYTGFCLFIALFWALVFGLVYIMADIK